MRNNFFRFYTYGKCLAPVIWKQRPNTNRLYYVYGGSAFFINHGTEYRLKENHIYIFPYNLEFKIRQDNSDRLKHMYFDFMAVPPIISDNFFEYRVRDNTAVYHTIKAIDLVMDNLYDRCTGKRIVKVVTNNEYHSVITHFFDSLFSLLCRELHIEPVIDIKLDKVLEYIYDHYDETLTIETLSNIACLNTSYFIRLFKKRMKITPYQFIREHRLNAAVSMLNGNLPVQEIAERTGFENGSSLCHALKKSMGISPTQYIKQVR